MDLSTLTDRQLNEREAVLRLRFYDGGDESARVPLFHVVCEQTRRNIRAMREAIEGLAA